MQTVTVLFSLNRRPTCTCHWSTWTRNAGTEYEETFDKREHDPDCPQHGQPNDQHAPRFTRRGQ